MRFFLTIVKQFLRKDAPQPQREVLREMRRDSEDPRVVGTRGRVYNFEIEQFSEQVFGSFVQVVVLGSAARRSLQIDISMWLGTGNASCTRPEKTTEGD